MFSEQNLASLIVLSKSTDGQVHCADHQGKSLSIEETDQITILFVPVLMVEQCLVYKTNYALYFLPDENELALKINTIKQLETDAILLIGTQKQKKIYLIENHKLVTRTSMSVTFESDKVFRVNENGKVYQSKDLAPLIKQIRFACGREVLKTGNNLFSEGADLCNVVLGKRKEDGQFVLYHPNAPLAAGGESGMSSFLDKISKGGGSEFTAVMQHPKNQMSVLAPLLAGQLAIKLNNKDVMRFNPSELCSGIACINKNTVILTGKMILFSNELEKQVLVSLEGLGNLSKSRKINDHECIPMAKTIKDIKRANEKIKQRPYSVFIKEIEQVVFSKTVNSSKDGDEKGDFCLVM